MDTNIVFTLKDLLLTLLWISLIVFVIFLILVVKEVFQSIRLIRKKIDDKEQQIDAIINVAPSIVKSVDKITEITANGFEGVQKGVTVIKKKINKNKEPEVEIVDEENIYTRPNNL